MRSTAFTITHSTPLVKISLLANCTCKILRGEVRWQFDFANAAVTLRAPTGNKNLDNNPPHLCSVLSFALRLQKEFVVDRLAFCFTIYMLCTFFSRHHRFCVAIFSSSLKSGFGQENCKRIRYDYDVLCLHLSVIFCA